MEPASRDNMAGLRLLGGLVRLDALHPDGFTAAQLSEYARVGWETARAFLNPGKGPGYTKVIASAKAAGADGRGRPANLYRLRPDRRPDLMRRLAEMRRALDAAVGIPEPSATQLFAPLELLEATVEKLERRDDPTDVWHDRLDEARLELGGAEADLRALQAMALSDAQRFADRLEKVQNRLAAVELACVTGFEPAVPLAMASINQGDYEKLFERSISDSEDFWREHGKRIEWIKPYTKVKDVSFEAPDIHIKWFYDGTLNASVNCLDRHLKTRGDQPAIIWEGDDPSVSKAITYRQLHEQVCKFANVLKWLGVRKGDRVTIYLPMIPELPVAMLACTRIGAIHSIVASGFSPDSLANRIQDCDSRVLITADEGLRGGRNVALKNNVDEALQSCPTISKVVVVKYTGGACDWKAGRDYFWHELMANASADCPPEEMNAEDPLFILYTSGSTGKPKGVLHTTGGYLVYVAMTHQYVFDYKDGEVYWCTDDIGWITGHSYIVYGPLANGAISVMFEGVPNYPDASRFWRVVDKHKVNIIYTIPTTIRELMREGEEMVKKTSRKSLRILGTVGEPINPEAWRWYYRVVGEERCPIVDTWWQTETGGILITPLPGATRLKAGSATRPFFGVQPCIVDADGKVLEGVATGNLCIIDAWPGIMRTVFRDHDQFVQTYFSVYPGKYFTGDGCRRDEDGYYWITGRVDDVINVAGHRMGTAEVESALVAHAKVAEAAVVGFPHDLKGQGIYAYVTLNAGEPPSEALRKELVQWVRTEIGPIASPDIIQWAPSLPKTRSGKIMRRILRKIAEDDVGSLGDTSTLADPTVVSDLIEHRWAA